MQIFKQKYTSGHRLGNAGFLERIAQGDRDFGCLGFPGGITQADGDMVMQVSQAELHSAHSPYILHIKLWLFRFPRQELHKRTLAMQVFQVFQISGQILAVQVSQAE